MLVVMPRIIMALVRWPIWSDVYPPVEECNCERVAVNNGSRGSFQTHLHKNYLHKRQNFRLCFLVIRITRFFRRREFWMLSARLHCEIRARFHKSKIQMHTQLAPKTQ